jgi:hypothetical protein
VLRFIEFHDNRAQQAAAEPPASDTPAVVPQVPSEQPAAVDIQALVNAIAKIADDPSAESYRKVHRLVLGMPDYRATGYLERVQSIRREHGPQAAVDFIESNGFVLFHPGILFNYSGCLDELGKTEVATGAKNLAASVLVAWKRTGDGTRERPYLLTFEDGYVMDLHFREKQLDRLQRLEDAGRHLYVVHCTDGTNITFDATDIEKIKRSAQQANPAQSAAAVAQAGTAKAQPAISIDEGTVMLNGVSFTLPCKTEQLVKVLGQPSRRENSLDPQSPPNRLIWDEAGIFAFLDVVPDTGHGAETVDSLYIAFVRQGKVRAWPHRAFSGRLVIDGAPVPPHATIGEINRQRRERAFVENPNNGSFSVIQNGLRLSFSPTDALTRVATDVHFEGLFLEPRGR